MVTISHIYNEESGLDARVKINTAFDALYTASSGTTYESGYFYIDPNVIGVLVDASPNVSIINPGATPIIRITTTKRLKLGFFSSMKTNELGQLYSEGRTDGNYSTITYKSTNNASAIAMGDEQNLIILVSNSALLGSPGWSGYLPLINITDAYFDIDMTQSGAGFEIFVRFHLEEA